ncbi:MAG: hypothetical protein M3Q89_03210, partial [Verrucomicrobiota bacterium]|nr:hypothetical protein [Verrucomicrobiota bacterium]
TLPILFGPVHCGSANASGLRGLHKRSTAVLAMRPPRVPPGGLGLGSRRYAIEQARRPLAAQPGRLCSGAACSPFGSQALTRSGGPGSLISSFFLVVAWWIFYRWRNIEQWTYFLFLVLLSSTILYLAAMVLFSPEGGSVQAPQDCRGHFYANRRSFFIFFGL